MSESDREINKCFGYVSSAVKMIENGDRKNAKGFLDMTHKIVNQYPKQAGSLMPKYEQAKELYEGKFGRLEQEVQ